MAMRRLLPQTVSIRWNTLYMTNPTRAINTKNSAMRMKTSAGRLSGSVKPVMTVRIMMPRMSSMTAAPRIAVPTLPRRRPISRRVSTVIETEVAVSTTPINSALSIFSGSPGAL